MNRFPKMVFLWEAIALKKMKLEPKVALCVGYAVATVYAILKNKGRSANFELKDKHEKVASERVDFQTLEIPGKHPPFLKKLPYRVTRDGVEFLVAGEWQNLTKKTWGFLKRFTQEQIDALRTSAKIVAGIIELYGYENWFEVWKAYRDKDWLNLKREILSELVTNQKV